MRGRGNGSSSQCTYSVIDARKGKHTWSRMMMRLMALFGDGWMDGWILFPRGNEVKFDEFDWGALSSTYDTVCVRTTLVDTQPWSTVP